MKQIYVLPLKQKDLTKSKPIILISIICQMEVSGWKGLSGRINEAVKEQYTEVGPIHNQYVTRRTGLSGNSRHT
jgi:hypothetical protein